MKINIYVVTHKVIDDKLPNNYNYILVNANSKDNPYKYGDNTLNNISYKNPNYCELTAGYWIWKNDKESDIVGLAHYRRLLTTNKFSNNVKSYVNEKNIEKDLKKYDFIATKMHKEKTKIKEHILKGNVRIQDLEKLEESIKEVYPDYIDTFNKVMNSKKSYLLNVMICKKSYFDNYYEWLFNIFDNLEKKVDMTGYNIQEQRLYGYLSERLFTVYVLKNKFKVKSYPIHTVGSSVMGMIVDKVLLKLGIRKR